MSSLIIACIEFNPDDNSKRPEKYKGLPTYVKGSIFKASTKLIEKIMASIKKKNYIDITFKNKSSEYETKLGDVYGNWIDHLYIDDQEVWNFKNIHPFKM